MGDYSSLVFFTILSQCAAGMMFVLACRARQQTGPLWLALVLAGLGALASLGHLGTPANCFYTVANIGSSWLSREIFMCICFCAGILACIIWRRRWLAWLTAFLGLVFIFVMSMIYMLPTEPGWDTPLTFFYFLVSSIILGPSLMLLTDYFHGESKNPLLGPLPVVIMAAAAFAILFGVQTMPDAGSPARAATMWYLVLLVLGAGVLLPLLSRCAARQSAAHEPADKENWLLPAVGITALIWAAEFCGRVGFYKSYVWFGM